MPAEPAQYRILGLTTEPPSPAPSVQEKPIDPAIPAWREVDLSEFRSRPSLEVALKALGRTTLIDFIPRAPMDRLSAWWPTFKFFHRPRGVRPLKTHPVALGPHLPDSKTLRTTPELQIIEQHDQEQIRENNQIESVLAMAESAAAKSRPRSIDSPIALALVHCLLHRSNGDDEARLLEIVRGNPVAAYILLHIGRRPSERENLVRAILSHPRLTFELALEGKFGRLALPDDLLPAAFAQAAHLLPLARYGRKKISEDDAWDALIESAAGQPMAAAFALGLDPTHHQARAWNARVVPNPEAIYWTLRVWLTHQFQAAKFPYWPDYQALIKKDVRWLYHWCRDIDSSEARDAIRWHWPNPWAVEIIADLKPEPDFVRELYLASFENSDEDDPLSNTLALWAAQFIEKQETNETFEND